MALVSPLHVRHFRDRANVGAVALLFAHVAVAVDAPPHAEGLLHAHALHLVDAAVALDAAHASVDVSRTSAASLRLRSEQRPM
jgi:hypothetical protein